MYQPSCLPTDQTHCLAGDVGVSSRLFGPPVREAPAKHSRSARALFWSICRLTHVLDDQLQAPRSVPFVHVDLVGCVNVTRHLPGEVAQAEGDPVLLPAAV